KDSLMRFARLRWRQPDMAACAAGFVRHSGNSLTADSDHPAYEGEQNVDDDHDRNDPNNRRAAYLIGWRHCDTDRVVKAGDEVRQKINGQNALDRSHNNHNHEHVECNYVKHFLVNPPPRTSNPNGALNLQNSARE